MGTIHRIVRRTSDAPLEYPAILKVPRFDRGGGAEGLLGFETEARILPALSGTHVPRVLAVGEITRTPYLAMEWVEGASVEEMIANGPLVHTDVARWGAEIADALDDIHHQGAIHLDLKPENVIVKPNGSVALIDFGMAHHERFPDLLAEQRRFASGSAPYISPEQVLGNRADLRSDLFSLGVMLYEMVTGRLPFGNPQTLAGLRDRLWLDPTPPRLLAPDTPRWLQEVILHCLETDAGQRYQSAAQVALDLRRPEHVALTLRAQKIERAGMIEHARRWWAARSRAMPRQVSAIPAASKKVLMVAVDTMHPEDARTPELRAATARFLAMSPEFRLICVSVVRGESGAVAANDGTPIPGVHMEHVVRLREWVGPLRVPESSLSLHVIEALNPSGTLLEFARNNDVDLIILGAPDPEQHALAWWRSVASSVTANARCSVYVVRV